MIYSKIIGTGSHLPEKVLTNFDLEKLLDTSDEWITSRSGIKKRHIVETETTCDLAEVASRNALDMAGVNVNELDLIILATSTPDKIFPSTASLLQKKLGSNCPVFDVQAVCAGFVYAITTANQYIKNGEANKVLVVGSETFSRIMNWKDRSTAVLFGDGAGAALLTSSNEKGIIYNKLCANSKYLSSLQTNNDIVNSKGFIEMNGSDVFKIAVNELSKLAQTSLKDCNMSVEDLDWFIPHQANIRIISAIAKKIGLSMDKVIKTVDKHGNTSAASVPLALDEAIRDNRIKKNDLCLLEAIGGGFTWGSVLFYL